MAHRKIFASLTAAAAMATVLAMPGIAVADTYWHPTNNEAGVKGLCCTTPPQAKLPPTPDVVMPRPPSGVSPVL